MTLLRLPKVLQRRRDEGGFTLLEMLVVLAIMGLLAAIIAPQVLKYLGSSRTQTAKVQIQNVVAALELYRLDVGRYPTQEEGLQAVITAPPTAPGWNGPYLQKSTALTDPWGHPTSAEFRASTARSMSIPSGPTRPRAGQARQPMSATGSQVRTPAPPLLKPWWSWRSQAWSP